MKSRRDFIYEYYQTRRKGGRILRETLTQLRIFLWWLFLTIAMYPIWLIARYAEKEERISQLREQVKTMTNQDLIYQRYSLYETDPLDDCYTVTQDVPVGVWLEILYSEMTGRNFPPMLKGTIGDLDDELENIQKILKTFDDDRLLRVWESYREYDSRKEYLPGMSYSILVDAVDKELISRGLDHIPAVDLWVA
jgi:hypothetical protein